MHMDRASFSKSENAPLLRILFCFGALMDPFGLMDLFEVVRLQETLTAHYEMIAKGFLLTFGLVMETMNR